MVCVLIVASGAAWEPTAMGLLTATPGVVVLKRCVDINDLLASATTGQADVAVVGLEAPGLDVTAVDHLRRHRMRVVAVSGRLEAARVRAARLGVSALVAEDELELLPEAVTSEGGPPEAQETAEVPPTSVAAPGGAGRVVACWGPYGAPGRTTVASGVAAELAARAVDTVLVDADPWGGAVAQQLGILEEVSGLLSAARLAAAGELAARFGTVPRRLSDRLSVVTGLPRPDRYVEVRAGVVEHLAEVASEHAWVVLDTGFSLESDPGSEFGARPGRNTMTLGALAAADEIVVVGSADPVGLSRLARALVDVRELTGGAPVRVAVNRMRPTLGWSEKEIAGMVEGFARISGLHFLPEDRAGVDRALATGRSLAETPESTLGRAVAALVDGLAPATRPEGGRRRGFRPRRAGAARPR